MTDLRVLQEARTRRAGREARRRLERRRRRRRRLAIGAPLAALVALLIVFAGDTGHTTAGKVPAVKSSSGGSARHAGTGGRSGRVRPSYGRALASVQIHPRLSGSLRSGMLFDVRTGQVLWQRRPDMEVPIASLTKMMTALVVVAHSRPSDRVLITKQAVHFTGSGVGELPLGKRVREIALLYGLLLPSGNDAAIALAQHVAGTQTDFVSMMNERAHQIGLGCSHFSTVSGVIDAGNHSCATDLAVLAHLVLKQRTLAPIVASRNAVVPFPIKGGKLWLYNNNPLLQMGYRGIDGVKTGFTTAAGLCLVVAAKRGGHWLAAVLLHSSDPQYQAIELLNAGFAALR